jgi:excisionase family DNA binding protein
MYSIPELAQKLGVHRATVHRWVRKGLLPATQVGTGRKIYLIPEEALKLCPKKSVSNSKRTQPTQPQLF